MHALLFFILFVAIVLICCAVGSAIIRAKYTIMGGLDTTKDLVKYPRSKSEDAVIRYFEDITGKQFPTILPDWLLWKGKPMELDGYCKELKCAVEFSGPLHTKWFPEREQYKSYWTRIMKDAVKLEICAAKGVTLIVIDMSLPPRHWRNYIASRLHDAGLVDRPCIYIEAQKAIPYRNEHMERELGLVDALKN